MGKIIEVKILRRGAKNVAFIKTLEGTVPVINRFEYDPQDKVALSTRLAVLKLGNFE